MAHFIYGACLMAWLCAAIASPSKPKSRLEPAELVYSRLIGRQTTITALAVVLTIAALDAALFSIAGT